MASDLDGTLLGLHERVSARTVASVQRAERAGAEFLFATGRPLRWVAPLADELGHVGWAVCANGAVVVDLHSMAVVHSRSLSAERSRQAVALIRRAVPGATFGVERVRDGFAHDPAYLPRFPVPPGTVVAPIDDLLDGPAVKLLVRHGDMDPDAFLAMVSDCLGGAAVATRSGSDRLCEVMAHGVSKASALAWVAEDRGLDHPDVIAFGDMPNDIEMLRWAGHGVAMANAHGDVLAVADEVTASNEQDGVALVLERLF